MALNDNLYIFLALIQGCGPLQFLVLLFEEEIEFVLLGVNHDLHFLIGLLLKLYPFIRCPHREQLPQFFVVFLVLAALEE